MIRRTFIGSLVLSIICGYVFGMTSDSIPVLKTRTNFCIDGSPKEWPIPATAFLESRFGNVQMRFAADNKNFYAFVEVEDPSPLKNSAGEPEEMFKGGDTVAFYFNSTGREGYWYGPQKVAVSMRNDEPIIYIYRPKVFGKPYGMKKTYVFKSPASEAKFDFVAPFDNKFSRTGPEFAFRKHGEKGYSLEISIPWGALRMKPTELTGFDAQVVFSNPSGTENIGSAWLFAREGPGLTIEDLPTEAKLYPDTWGKLEFVQQIPAKPKSNFSKFDRKVGGVFFDVEVPEDAFLTINITDENGWILRELVMAKKFSAGKHSIYWDGRDRYGEPLPKGKYLWKGILFDHMRTKFIGSVGNSGRPPYRTADGLGSMGGQHGHWKTVAIDDTGVYMANAMKEGPPVMRKVDEQTGVALWTCNSAGLVKGIAAGEGMACLINKSGNWGRGEFQLIRISPDTGKEVRMENGSSRLSLGKDIKEIGGIAIVDGYAWISLPEKNIITSFNLKTGVKGKVFNVTEPQGIAKKDNKSLLVCSENNIIEIDTLTGISKNILKNMDAPRAICVDKQGYIYVSELGNSQIIRKFSPDGTKLIAVFGQKGGKTNQQIPYEPTKFRNVTDIAVAENGNLWLAESDGLVRRFVKLDSNGKWLEDFYGPVAYNTFGPDLDDFSRVYYTITDGCFIETKIDYNQYQKDPMDPAKAWHIEAIHDLGLATDGKSINKQMKAVASKGYGHVYAFKADNGKRYLFRPSKHNRAVGHDGAGLWVEKQGRWIPCAFISKNTDKMPSWADQNGDGLIQDDERYTNMPPVGEVSWIDKDFTLHGFKGKLAIGESLDSGAPVYEGGSFKAYLAEGENDYLDSGWTFFSKEEDGSVYYILNHGPHRHLGFWDRATENRLIKIKHGKVQWILGKHETSPGFTGLSTCSGVAGSLDGIVLVNNIEPCNYIAYTEDGFVLGDIMANENGWHENYQPYTINIESFTGLYVKDPKTEKNILFTVSSGDDRILEVIGPKNIKRIQGRIKLKNASPASDNKIEIPYYTWYGNTVRGMGIDGADTEWNPKIKTSSLLYKKQVVADVKLRRDAGNLYLYSIVNDQNMKSGDGVELVLKSSAGVVYTLLITIDKDKNSNWICRSKFMKNNNEIPNAKINAAIQPRWKNFGYRLEAELPLELIRELALTKEITFKRKPKKKTDSNIFKDVRLDLKAPVYINLKIIGADYPAVLSADFTQAVLE